MADHPPTMLPGGIDPELLARQAGPPRQQPQIPPALATDLAVAGAKDEQSGLPILVFQFQDRTPAAMQFPPIILRTADLPDLPDLIGEQVNKAFDLAGMLPKPDPVICRGPCGRRIFGDAAERGVCFECEPA